MIEKQGLTDCLTFEDRLNDLIDSRLSLADDPGVARHARDCAVCARLLDDYQQLQHLSVHSKPETEKCIPGAVGRYQSVLFQPPPKPSLTWQARRSKWKWAFSLTPSIAALLIVTISILKGSGAPEGFVGSDTAWERPGLQSVVAQAGDPAVSTKDFRRNPASSNYPYDPIVDSVFIKSGVIEGMQDCSGAIYQLANAQSQFRSCDWKFDVVSQVTSPYEPIHSQVPYRGEFSAIPKFRFLLGITLQLIEMTFSGQLDWSKPDLGFQTEIWRKFAMA